MSPSIANFNGLPVLQDSTMTLNLKSFQLAVLIVGLIEFFLVHVLLGRKKISSFLSGFQQPRFPNPVSHENPNIETTTKQDKKSNDQSVSRNDIEMVLRSLGMVSNGEHEASRLPSRIEADDLFAMFEERNPGLDEVKQAFDVFDDNRDGFIDAEDLQKVLCRLGLKQGSEIENCRRMIGVFDDNEDGKMDFDEFVKFMENSYN